MGGWPVSVWKRRISVRRDMPAWPANNPGAYRTGFNDRIADTTFRWLDDSVNVNRTKDVKAGFAEILADQYDPQDMIDKMVEIIGADRGKYRNVWPPAVEELVKQVQDAVWTRTVPGT